MPKVKDGKVGKKLKCLFVGKSGTFKTSAIGGFPEPIYIFNTDVDRMEPLIMWQKHRDIEYDDYRIGELNKMKSKMDTLSKYNPYRTIAFDSWTTLGQLGIYESRADRSKGMMVGKSGFMKPDPFDYGSENAILWHVINFMNSLKCHVILTAHIIKTEEVDPDSVKADGEQMMMSTKKRVKYDIVTAGKKASAMLEGNFNEVWHFFKEQPFRSGEPEIRKIATRMEHALVNAKTALPLPDVIDWTKEPLYDIIAREVVKANESISAIEAKDPLPEPNSNWGGSNVS